MRRTLGCVSAIAVFLVAQVASAAELKVYSTIGVKGALEALIPQFEKQSGHKVNITWGLVSSLTKQVQDGDVPDVLIVTRAGIDSLIKEGKIAADGATLASSGTAAAVKQATPKPDISSAAALKKALLGARTTGYSDPALGSATGIDKAKSKIPPQACFAGELAIKQEIGLAVPSNPKPASPTTVVADGLCAVDLTNVTVFAVGIGATSTNSAAGKALVEFLTSPQAQAVIKANGFNPA
jgi:molybdate transport system substrate-binding protein